MAIPLTAALQGLTALALSGALSAEQIDMLEQADAIARKLHALREVIAARLRHVYTGVRPRGI